MKWSWCTGRVVSWCLFLSCLLPTSQSSPAYSQSSYNSVGNSNQDRLASPHPTQSPRRTESNGERKTIQNAVRLHMEELDSQTQHDLTILNYLENELNQIFSCYIRLSCPRTRSAKVLAECDEIKDWPLYHQVMKMAGIRRYPYQNYAPQYRPAAHISTPIPVTSAPYPAVFDNHQRVARRERVSDLATSNQVNNVHRGEDEDDDNVEYYQRDARYRPRRIPKGQTQHKTVLDNKLSDE